ncbi:MAG: hypothetical protein A2X36_10230 [Elusimicrobia bacterium GWA2_69_24]|nr:MAG: hypothetical protein A2X36_10230 [Elusimicrobia bacterium GWA2_69_24]
MDPMKAFQILELEADASFEDVKRAYRRLAKEWHPDLYPYGPELRRQCERKMALINSAYALLREAAKASSPPTAEAGPDPEATAPDPPPPAEASAAEEAEAESDPGLEPWAGKTAEPRPRWDPFVWNVPEDKPDYPSLLRVGAGFVACSIPMGLFFVLKPANDAYFAVVRIAATGAVIYAAVFGFNRGYWEFGMLLVLFGFVMNPFLPVILDLWEWKIFCFLAPFLLTYIWLEFYRQESRRR